MKLSQVSAKNLEAFNQKNTLKGGPRSVFSSHYSKASRVKSAAASRKSKSIAQSYSTHQARIDSHKQKIIEAVNELNEEELERVSEMLKVAEQIQKEENENEQEGEAQEGEGEFERDGENEENNS